jgi:ketosteroid isomerase-like protein
MRCAVSLLIALCLWAAPAFSQTTSDSAQKSATVAASQSESDAIRQIEADLVQSERTTDIAVQQRILAEDLVNLGPRGLGPGKAGIIKGMQPHAGEAPPYSVETQDMRIYVLGETAVAAFVKIYTSKENGNVAREDTTHVFTKDHGVWKLRISRASNCL